jgi:hypothetical protein
MKVLNSKKKISTLKESWIIDKLYLVSNYSCTIVLTGGDSTPNSLPILDHLPDSRLCQIKSEIFVVIIYSLKSRFQSD